MEQAGSQCGFDTTEWTLVEQLRSPDPRHRERAAETMFGRYWPPVFGAVRRMGYGHHEASEATQAFFADVVLGRGLFEQAEEGKGRLRTLVLTALKRHLVDRHRREAARGADRRVPLHGLEREEAIVASSPEDAETLFNRRWAVVVLEEALRRAERHFIESGRAGHWRVFESRVLLPTLSAVEPPPVSAVALQHGFATAADASAAVQVVRRRVVALMREVIAETTSDPAEQEEEFALVVSLAG